MITRKRLVSFALAVLLLSSAMPATALQEPDASWLETLQDLGSELLLKVFGRSEGSGDQDPPAIPDFDPNGATTTLGEPAPSDAEAPAVPDFDPNG